MLKRLFSKYPLFLLLLPIFIVTHIEREYQGLINYGLVYGEIIWLLLIPVAAYGLSWLLMRSTRKASIFALAVLVVYYFFGETKDWLKSVLPGSIWQSYIFLILFFLALLIVAAFFVKRSSTGFTKAFLFFNTVLSFFIIFDVAVITFKSVSSSSEIEEDKAIILQHNKGGDPDIYYFIFDSYTSSAFLKEKFDFDNSAIDSSLVKKGFRTIRNSHSNYNLTPFSMGATFRGVLWQADTTAEYNLRNYLPGVREVYDNPYVAAFDKLGYEIHNHSIFNIKKHPTTIPAFDIWDLKSIYQQHNLLVKADREIGWNFPRWMRLYRHTIFDYARDRDRHDSIALKHIYATIGKPSKKPKFTYGHLFIPHSPYTFDSAGNKIDPIGIMPLQEDMKAYTQQIIYVNKVMERLVNEIQSKTKRPLVIIIQGDHGYRFFEKDKKQWEFPNFNAFYFSNGDYRYLHDSLTSVNTFNVLSNTFFGRAVPMEDPKTYFLQYK